MSSGEGVFLPLSVRLTPLRRPAVYSPLPDQPSEAGSAPGIKKRKLAPSVKKTKIKKTPKPSSSSTSFVRERKTAPRKDIYYAQRLSRVAEPDVRLAGILGFFKNNFFNQKSVCELGTGVGFVAFYVAAYLGASRVVSLESDFALVLENLKQLRKFKHDGIRIDSGKSHPDDYPSILVRRCGVPRITNKPWRVPAQDSATSNFPFNIEFRWAAATQPPTETFDRVIVWKGVPANIEHIIQLLAPGGIGLIEEPAQATIPPEIVCATLEQITIADRAFLLVARKLDDKLAD